jgi:CubicO group peptidase (beta-lactamase class C family)
MSTLVSKLTDIQARLDALAVQHKVPGASLGVMLGDEYVEFVTGVANVDTKLPVTNDTLFQIGSITKVYTSTLVMRLVDQKKIDLDAPVKKYVPEFTLADKSYLDKITVRQLLTHTNGIDGADYFDDFGKGDDAIERFVASMSKLGQLYPPGAMWSYCNAGTVLAGRVIEKVTGSTFADAFHEALLEPLGVKNTTLRIEDMLVRSCATGHITLPGASEPSVTPSPLLPLSCVPAGSLTCSTPRDLMTFVRMHLDGGRAAGKRFLSERSTKQMQTAQVQRPRYFRGAEMGIGWSIADFGGERVLAHTGGTIGQLAFLYVMPDRRFAFALLTNSGGGLALFADLGRWIFEEFTGVWMTAPPKPPDDPPKLDLRKYVGTYERRDNVIEVSLRDGSLVAKMQYTGGLTGIGEPQEVTLRPFDAEMFQTAGSAGEGLTEFMGFGSDGRPRFLHMGRVAKRVGGKPRTKKAKAKAKSKPSRAKKSGSSTSR